MKSVLLSYGLLLSLFAFSCQKTENTNEGTTSQTAVSKPKADQIIRDTVTNKAGVQLTMAFNNTKQTARFVLKGEIIDLKQDQMASGIKYSNSAYEYGEHQGEMTLKKNGETVFSYKR